MMVVMVLAVMLMMMPISSLSITRTGDGLPMHDAREASNAVVYARNFVSSGAGTEEHPFVGEDGAAGILAAMESVPAGVPLVVVVSSGFHQISTSLNLRSSTTLLGAGMNDTILTNSKPYRKMPSWGKLYAGVSVQNLTVDGNRYGDGVPIGQDCSFHGFEIAGAGVVLSSIKVTNMACGGILPHNAAIGFELSDSIVQDSHFGLWAEATCGYAAHKIVRNFFVTTRPGAQDAFDYDNGNVDGLMNCTQPATQELRNRMRNQIIGNTVLNSCKLGIAVARMGGFLIQDNLVIAPSPEMRDCSYHWCSPTGGNPIHIEHESFDIEIVNNRVRQGGNCTNCSVVVGIWVADSTNVTITGNTVHLENSTRDCIQFAADICQNVKPNHQNAHHDSCVARDNFHVLNNTVRGGRVGANVW